MKTLEPIEKMLGKILCKLLIHKLPYIEKTGIPPYFWGVECLRCGEEQFVSNWDGSQEKGEIES